MRIAVLIIGLVLTAILFFQALTISALSGAISKADSQAAAATGLLMAFLWLVSCGLVIPKPRISVVLFAVAAIIGAAGWSAYPDLQIWSGVSVALAVLSYFGYRGKRKQDAKEAARDATMQQLLTNQSALVAPAGAIAAVTCLNCGSMERFGASYCGSCGTRLAP